MTPAPAQRGPGRPPAASKADVEQTALALMLRDGYDSVSVDAIAAAVGIGRTTFFRYFGSKPGVIWAAFDQTIAWLRGSIDESPAHADVLTVIREAIVYSTRSAIFSSDVWLERFQLLDGNASLRSDAYERWERWKSQLAEYVAAREGSNAFDALPMAIAGACQGIFIAELRNLQNSDQDREAMLSRLDVSLREIGDVFRPMLRGRSAP